MMEEDLHLESSIKQSNLLTRNTFYSREILFIHTKYFLKKIEHSCEQHPTFTDASSATYQYLLLH